MLKPLSSLGRMCVALIFAGSVVVSVVAQQPSPPRPRGVPQPPDPGPRFFSENWRNPRTYDANTLPLTSVTQEVVTTPDLVLNVYDPNAKYIPDYRKTLRPGSWADDWGGPTCLLIYGIQRPELWAGSCGAVTVTLRQKNNFVDLSNRGRVIWGTYVSGFHVARLVVKLADGTFLVGDPGTGTPDVSHIENEVVLSRFVLKLDVPQTLLAAPGLKRESCEGGRDWLDSATPGWPRGVGGFVSVSKFEVAPPPPVLSLDAPPYRADKDVLMNVLDYVVLISTMVAIAAYGIWKTRHLNDLSSFVRGAGRSRWLGIGLSVMATQAMPSPFCPRQARVTRAASASSRTTSARPSPLFSSVSFSCPCTGG